MKLMIENWRRFSEQDEKEARSSKPEAQYDSNSPASEVKNFFESLKSSEVKDAIKYFDRKVPRDQKYPLIKILEGKGSEVHFKTLFIFAKYLKGYAKIEVPNFDKIAKSNDYDEEYRSGQPGGPGASMLLDGILSALGLA
tara:strand:+ start:571 stop:990 length:420 start_codon:yes stop_codon:yes gene_type:complete